MRRLILFFLLTFPCLSGALAAPKSELWSIWLPSDEDNLMIVDHGEWQRFLDQFVKENPDGVNRIAYKQIERDRGMPQLKRYLELLSTTDPTKLSRREQLVYWINLYNALTIKVVLNNAGKSSILKMGRRFFSFGPWNDPLVVVAGVELTLNDIEHRILRPIWQDRRIHYAVNCASLGCPNLSRQAYTSETAEQLMHVAEKNYLNHPRGVAVLDDGSLRLSSIFKWYLEDFGASEADLMRYLAQHSSTLTSFHFDQATEINYEYDWSLNALEPR